MEEPLFMFQLIIAVDVSEHRSIYNKLNAPCSGDFNSPQIFPDTKLSLKENSSNNLTSACGENEVEPILPK